MNKFGIIYLSFGLTYVDCTVAALQSKSKNAPRTPALLITNRKADLNSKICKQGNIDVKYVDAKQKAVREYKTQLYKYSPFEYTLLLDADAWINKELAGQFKILDCAPIALTHAFFHPSIGSAQHIGLKDRTLTIDTLKGAKMAPQYASGLIFFRRDDPKAQTLFDTWYKEWKIFEKKDQGALMRAIIKTQVFPLVLWRDHWLTPKQGKGYVSHRFTYKLPSMPRKDRASPMKYKAIP